MAGAPLGNRNAAKVKPWQDALRRAIARYDGGAGNALNLIADQVVTEAINGKQWAIEEIGNRFDGKPKQQLEHTGENDGPIQTRLLIIDSRASG